MISPTFRHLGLAILALSIGIGTSAYAQQSVSPPLTGSNDEGKGGFEHQKFREEMEEIRKEHEELEADRDKLIDNCVNNHAMSPEACEQRKKELHERMEVLHERMRALHEEMGDRRGGPSAMHPSAPPTNTPSPTAN